MNFHHHQQQSHYFHHNNNSGEFHHQNKDNNYYHQHNHEYNEYNQNNQYSPHHQSHFNQFNPQYEDHTQRNTSYHNTQFQQIQHHASTHHNNGYHTAHHHSRSYYNVSHHHHHHHHNVRREQHEILSANTGTFTFAKKVREAPIFYDKETALAQRCNVLQKRYENTMFEQEEKERLLHFERCDLIRDHEQQRKEDRDSDSKPVTPSASDYGSSHEVDEGEDSAQEIEQHVVFGAMRDTKIRSILEATQDYVMWDENGTNLLENDRSDAVQYGIYNADGIKIQAMMVPDAPTIDGEYIANNAKCVQKKQMRKDRKQKKTRRGRKKSKKLLTREEIDERRAKELVAYLEMSRK